MILNTLHIEEAKRIKNILDQIKYHKVDSEKIDKLGEIANDINSILEEDISNSKKLYLSESKKKEMKDVFFKIEEYKILVIEKIENLYQSINNFYPKEKIPQVLEEIKKILYTQ